MCDLASVYWLLTGWTRGAVWREDRTMKPLLNTVEYGAPGGVPLLVVHGLFGAARNWRALARRFAEHRHVVCVDMRNHGESFWSEEMTYPVMADDLAAVVEAHGGQADVLGHSMGGKAAMVLALQQPDLLRALIVADIAPVAYDHSQLPVIDAMRHVDISNLSRRSEAQAALTEATGDAGLGAFLSQSVILSPDGNRWTLNLDALAANMDAIIGFPEVDGRFEGPTFFVTGAASDYVRAEHTDLVQSMFPQVQHKALANAGHWLHADQPNAFIRAVNTFLSDLGH